MRSLKALVIRNLKCYIRYKSNIIYSLLSIIITVGLYILFMSKTYTDSMKQILEPFGATNYQWMSDSIMLSGLIPILSISVSLVALAIIVEDKQNKIAMDFMVAPINRNIWMLSYLISSLIICSVASLALIVFSDLYLFFISGYALTFLQLIKILGITLLGVFFGNMFMVFLISFAKTTNVVGGMGTIVGTLQGFISGCYMPLGVFPKTMRYILYSLPFAQMSSLIRDVYLENATKVMGLSAEGSFALNEISKFYGIELHFGNWNMPLWLMIISVLSFTIIFAIIAGFRFLKFKNK
ncbi:MAG TPA: ABC transporter permease [Clostridia bacterium]